MFALLIGRRRIVQATLTVVVALAAITELSAHEGPPFPILMDQRLADYQVSVWADPDIGEAQFFIILEAPEGGEPREAPRGVSMWLEPVSGRLERVTVQATRQNIRNQMQFEARPHFDQQDEWNVGFQLTDQNRTSRELTTTIVSTPPGYGPWDLAIYLFPFLLLAGFWALAMMRLTRCP